MKSSRNDEFRISLQRQTNVSKNINPDNANPSKNNWRYM